jgi:hypothetical protein
MDNLRYVTCNVWTHPIMLKCKEQVRICQTQNIFDTEDLKTATCFNL